MSVGTPQSVENTQKEQFQKKGTVEIAKNWCTHCRKVLGLGIGFTDSSEMESSIQKTVDGLDDLKSFAGFDESLKNILDGYSSEFMGLAFDLEVLRREYRQFEEQKEAAKFFSKDRENASANMKKKYEQIVLKAKELKALQGKIDTTVKNKESSVKLANAKIKQLPEGEDILKARKEFGKKLVLLRKLQESFAKNFDPTSAGEVGKKLNEFAKLDWTTVVSKKDADGHLQSIINAVSDAESVKLAHKKGKELYDASIEEYRKWMAVAETVVPVDKLQPLLAGYVAGVNGAGEKNWSLAGSKINATELGKLKLLLGPAQNNYDIWTRLRENDYATLKNQLEGLAPPQYRLIGLGNLANAVAVGEQTKDYAKAVSLLNKAIEEVQPCVDAGNSFIAGQLEVQKLASTVTMLANGVTGDAQKFAVGFVDAISQVVSSLHSDLVLTPFSKNAIPSVDEISKATLEAKNKLTEFQKQIESLSDPTTLQNLEEAYRKKRSVEPLVEQLSMGLEQAKKLARDYLAMNADPTIDTTKDTEWKKIFSDAALWLQRRENDFVLDNDLSYDEQSKTQKRHWDLVQQVIVDATQLTETATQQIDTLRGTLTKEIDLLGTWLKASRLTTLREETWHAAANEELKGFQAIVQTDNKSAMNEAIARIEVLKDQCKNLIKDTGMNILIPQDSFIQYDLLKERLQAMIKRLAEKDLLATMRKGAEIYGGKQGIVASTLQELRNDGAGSMVRTFTTWSKKIVGLEAEVKREVFDKYEALKGSKKLCLEKITTIRERIMGELCKKIKEASGKTISGLNLELYGRLTEVQGGAIAADSKERFDQLIRLLDEINKEIDWAIEDTANGLFKDFIDQDKKGEELQQKLQSENAGLRGRYEIALSEFEKAKAIASKSPEVDEGEFKRYVDAAKAAKGAYKNKNLAEAAKRMELASRMMKGLAKNPKGSQVTGRGQENLSQLNARWRKGIETLEGSLGNLSKAISQSLTEASDEFTADQGRNVQSKFNEQVVTRVLSDFDAQAFERGLLVLQAPAPKDKAAQEKDLANKKKYRESLLAISRRYQDFIQKNPANNRIFFQPNPWQKENGFINAVELMRAINDINLNVERGVG